MLLPVKYRAIGHLHAYLHREVRKVHIGDKVHLASGDLRHGLCGYLLSEEDDIRLVLRHHGRPDE